MAGLTNNGSQSIVFADNVDFSGATVATATVTQDGELLIGSSSAPYLAPALLTSNQGTITPTFGSNSINLDSAMTITGDSGTDIIPNGPVQFTGGSGITVSTSAAPSNVVTITGTGGGFAWITVTSADNPVSLAEQTGYISKGAGAVTFKLPATATVGDMFIIAGYGNLWTLTQNAGQTIYFGSAATTTGVGGSLTATNAHDTLTIVCVTTDVDFHVLSSIGNLTVV